LSLAEAEISHLLCTSPHADEHMASALQSLHPGDAADPCNPCSLGGGGSPPRRRGAGGPRRLSACGGATSSRCSFSDWALFRVPLCNGRVFPGGSPP